MTEYRLVGSAIIEGVRQRIWFHTKDGGPSWSALEAIFSIKCGERGYDDPVLIDWYPA